MELSFGEKLKSARKAMHLTQKQLASMIDAAHNSISDWENDKNKPDPDTIELLCGVLEITPNYLLTTTSDDFSPLEKSLIKKYRQLDAHGKEMVDIVLDKEHERVLNIRVQESGLLAAHARTDMDQSSDAVQQDLDLMNDDSKWE